MRCGTTSLHQMLRAHPSLCFPQKKEIHFFDKRNPQLGDSVERYGELFTTCSSEKLCGEATPDYLTTEGCDRHIQTVIPQTKLVIILRNPVDRTWSHYLFSEFKRVETLGFREALDREVERLKIKSDHSDIFYSYLQRSRYIDHVVRFETLFGREQIIIVFLEELIRNPRSVLADLLHFLGLGDTSLMVAVPHLNRMVKPGNVWNRLLPGLAVPPRTISQSDRRYLESYFAEYNHRLSSWLGRALPWDQ